MQSYRVELSFLIGSHPIIMYHNIIIMTLSYNLGTISHKWIASSLVSSAEKQDEATYINRSDKSVHAKIDMMFCVKLKIR